MGVICEQGEKIKIAYDCVGKGIMEISTFDEVKLESSLKKYITEKDIKICEINEVCYNYDPIDYKKSAKELGIPDRAIITLKLKSAFHGKSLKCL